MLPALARQRANLNGTAGPVVIPSAAPAPASGGNAADRTAAQAAGQLAQRERDIRSGAWAIEEAFAPILGADMTLAPGNQPGASIQGRIASVVQNRQPPATDFFGDFERAIVAQQQPQLQRQFDDTFGIMATDLARRGMLDSTVGAGQQGRLNAAFADEAANIQNRARNEAMGLRQRIEQQKTDLLSLNAQAADPTMAGAMARSAATSIVAPSPSPIGDVFAGFIEPVAMFRGARMNAPDPRPQNTAPVATGAGSSRIVGGARGGR